MICDMSIGDVARSTHLRTSAIRYYESVGLLPTARRVSGRRRYDHHALQRLGVIQIARQAGLTIAEIRTLVNGFPVDTPPSERWQTVAGKKLSQIKQLIEQATVMKDLLEQSLQCQCRNLDECVTPMTTDVDTKVELRCGCSPVYIMPE